MWAVQELIDSSTELPTGARIIPLDCEPARSYLKVRSNIEGIRNTFHPCSTDYGTWNPPPISSSSYLFSLVKDLSSSGTSDGTRFSPRMEPLSPLVIFRNTKTWLLNVHSSKQKLPFHNQKMPHRCSVSHHPKFTRRLCLDTCYG